MVIIKVRTLIQRFIAELRRSMDEFHTLYENNQGAYPLGIDPSIDLPRFSASPLIFTVPGRHYRNNPVLRDLIYNFNRAYQSINNYSYSISRIRIWFSDLATHYGGYLSYVLLPLVQSHIVPLVNIAASIHGELWNVTHNTDHVMDQHSNINITYSALMSEYEWNHIHDVFVNQSEYLAMVDSGALSLVDSFVLFAFFF